jgi:L-2-hydroxyglutarate oxidase
MAFSRVDLAIVGGGIVGLAVARELLIRHPKLRVVVLEKEDTIARHQSGHNSGVIHSGVYYAPGSLKAKLCISGGAELYRYCAQRKIPAERCGKVIVAVDNSELPRLMALFERGVANGIEGLRLIEPAELRRVEPSCTGVGALLVPSCGITDYGLVCESYAEDVKAAGGRILPGHHVVGIHSHGSGSIVRLASGGELDASQVIACAGLHSDELARRGGGAPDPAIIPFRGDYWLLGRPSLVKNLIYPVPDPALPFLGVHFTRRISDGSIWLGPNAVLALAREGYGRVDLKARELVGTLRQPGFWHLARRHWRTGLNEVYRDDSRRALLRDLRRYLPDLTLGDIRRGPSGVRAQAVGRDGALLDDFAFEAQGKGVLHVRNAPSPAATSSLAIAHHIANRVEEQR